MTNPSGCGAGELFIIGLLGILGFFLFVPVTAEESTGAISVAPVAPSSSGETPGTLMISNALNPGDITAEAIEIMNSGPAVDLNGWTLVDESGTTFTFPEITLFTGSTLRVNTRSGQDTPTALYWGQQAALLSPGESITLIDAAGDTRAVFQLGESR